MIRTNEDAILITKRKILGGEEKLFASITGTRDIYKDKSYQDLGFKNTSATKFKCLDAKNKYGNVQWSL